VFSSKRSVFLPSSVRSFMPLAAEWASWRILSPTQLSFSSQVLRRDFSVVFLTRDYQVDNPEPPLFPKESNSTLGAVSPGFCCGGDLLPPPVSDLHYHLEETFPDRTPGAFFISSFYCICVRRTFPSVFFSDRPPSKFCPFLCPPPEWRQAVSPPPFNFVRTPVHVLSGGFSVKRTRSG